MQLADALADYAFYCKQKNITAATWRFYEHKLRLFFGWLAEQDPPITSLPQIKPALVYRFTEHLRTTPGYDTHRFQGAGTAERSSHTIRGYAQVIKGFLRWAADEELVEPRVAARVVMPSTEKKLIRTFSREQYHALVVAATNEFLPWLTHRDRALLSVLLDTGIRASEVCSLTLDRLSLTRLDPYLLVFGKGRKEREVGPLGVETNRLLRRYLRARPSVGFAEVFLSRRHTPLTPFALDKVLGRLEHWAGPERFAGVRVSAHTFRHTYAVNFLRTGGSIFDLKLLLGHTDIATTQRYLQDYQQRDARRGRSLLDSWLSNPA